MKLLQRLKELPSETKIQLGSGTAYFWFGNAGECICDIHKISIELRDSLYQRLLNYNRALRLTKAQIEKMCIEKKETRNTYKRQRFDKLIESKKFEVSEIEGKIEKTKCALDNFKELKERNILDEYFLFDSPGYTAIIVSGDETGRYWNVKEWDRSHVRRKG